MVGCKDSNARRRSCGSRRGSQCSHVPQPCNSNHVCPQRATLTRVKFWWPSRMFVIDYLLCTFAETWHLQSTNLSQVLASLSMVWFLVRQRYQHRHATRDVAFMGSTYFKRVKLNRIGLRLVLAASTQLLTSFLVPRFGGCRLMSSTSRSSRFFCPISRLPDGNRPISLHKIGPHVACTPPLGISNFHGRLHRERELHVLSTHRVWHVIISMSW